MPPTSPTYDFLDPPQRDGEIGRMGPYRILRLIGKGGMGQVFHARDARLQRHVALKWMNEKFADAPNSRKKFVEEARSMAAVHHDNVATIFEVGIHRSVPFLAMELLQGQPLNLVMKEEKQFHYSEVLRLAREVSHGLAAAHSRGIIHRDIKPGNIWIEQPSGRAKILDFGLAITTVSLDGMSPRGTAVGSPAYLAPEQARNDPVDERTDLYSLGVVLYQMCAGRLPLKGDSVTGQMIANLCIIPRPLRERSPETPLPLCELIDRLLQKEPRNRPRSAPHFEQLIDDVAHRCEAGNQVAVQIVTEKPAEKSPRTPTQSSTPSSERNSGREQTHKPPPWLVWAAGLITLIVAIAWWLSNPDRVASEPLRPTPTVSASKEINPESLRPLVLSSVTGTAVVMSGEAARFKVRMDNRALTAAGDPRQLNAGANVAAQIVTLLQAKGRTQYQRPTFPKKLSARQLPAFGQSQELEIQFLTAGMLPGSFDVIFELQAPGGRAISRMQRELTINENLNESELLGFQQLRTHVGRGADTYVRSGSVEDYGGAKVLQALRKGASEQEHIYLRFDLSKSPVARDQLDRAVLLLTVQAGGHPGVSEFTAYGILSDLESDWIETKQGHLSWQESPCRDGVGGQQFLAEARLDNTQDVLKDKPDAVRIFGPGLDDFIRSAPSDRVTIVLIRDSVADKPTLFKSREGKPTQAPALALRPKPKTP